MELPSPAQTRARRSMLIVDDDDSLRERLVRALSKRGFETFGAADLDQAVEIAARRAPSHAIMDLCVPGASGLELLRELRTLRHDMRVVIYTGYGSIASAVEALRAGAENYLTKPADVDEIIAAFEQERTASLRQVAAYSVPSLDRVEWEHIQRVLHGCAGNISHAARLLGLHRRSLQRKLAKVPTQR
jgi:two-component system response regulator RegA